MVSLAFLVPLIHLGMNGAASAVVLRAWALLPLTLFMIRRYAGINTTDVVFAMIVPLLSACVLWASVYGIRTQELEPLAAPLMVAVYGLVGAAVYLGTMWAADRSLVTELVSIAFGLLRRGG
jgi:uncharacterized protein with PQ loop repeat